MIYAERRELRGALIAFACIVGPFWLCCGGCKQVPKEQAIQVTLSVAAYAAELRGCLEKARPSGQFAVYEECAKGVDAKYGRKP
jgi:hypothetical protein